MRKLIFSTFLLLSLMAQAEEFPQACINYFALVQTLGKDDPYLKDFEKISQKLRKWWKTADKKDRARLKTHCEARKIILEQELIKKSRGK